MLDGFGAMILVVWWIPHLGSVLKVLENFQQPLRALSYLVKLPVGAKSLVNHPWWIPKGVYLNGLVIEINTNTGSNAKAKNLMAFGGGGRTCAGAEFSKVLMAVFLHVLVTKYRWTNIKGGDVVRAPTLGFSDGFYVSVSPKHASNIEE
ncbi:Detected protein of unknown function [Hibiscus syriacus]|uniref:Cytochrome P450 n=1 Tax=Hibiscus syriacus TaxID=106335 RepID=A0A6A2XFR8_HIBSY|nr:Detected protein of unknown function [Hibiscus syriacus]